MVTLSASSPQRLSSAMSCSRRTAASATMRPRPMPKCWVRETRTRRGVVVFGAVVVTRSDSDFHENPARVHDRHQQQDDDHVAQGEKQRLVLAGDNARRVDRVGELPETLVDAILTPFP